MMDESKCARCGHGPVLPNGLCLHCTEADGTTLARVNIELAALRAECERLPGWLWCSSEDLKCAEKRIEELEAALTEIHELLSNYHHGKAKARAAAALKGDTSEIRRRASPDDKHPEDRIVH